MDGIETFDMSGRHISLKGFLYSQPASFSPGAAELAQVLAERQRLMGYVGNFDESVVPIIWDCDPTVNGFYRITDAKVDFDGPSMETGVFNFTVEADQILGYASPQFEVLILGAGITNPHGVTGESWFAFPDVVSEQLYRTDCRDAYTRNTPDGALQFTRCFAFYSGTLRYYLTPESFYVGAGVIEVNDPLEICVGTQIPRSPDDWRLSNGLVRVTPGGDGRFAISHYDGTQWDNAKVFEIAGHEPVGYDAVNGFNAGRITGFSNLTILRNSPETVSIRLSCNVELGFTWGRVFVDITLRRGDRMARFYLHSDQSDDYRVRPYIAEAATALTGGLRATNSDGDGNRYVIAYGSKAVTTTLATGTVALSAISNQFDFGIGSEIGGSAAIGSATAQALIEEFFAGQTELLLVVSR